MIYLQWFYKTLGYSMVRLKKILFIINIRNKNGYCLPLKSEGGFFPNPERVLIAPQALYIPFS